MSLESRTTASTRPAGGSGVRPMIFALGAMLIVAVVSLQVLSILRAYVGGEGLYSKGQKDAVFYLTQYANVRESDDYDRYRQAIAKPLGDASARRALLLPEPDRARAREGFLAGGNHPDDVNGLVWFFILFRRVPPFDHALDLWTRADACNDRIAAVALRLHSPELAPGGAIGTRAAVAELNRINRDIAPIEDEFSATIAKVARTTTLGLAIALAVFTAFLAAVYIRTVRARHGERRRYERALRTSEGRYRAIFESNIDAILVVDPDGTILRANPAAATLFALSPGALIGRDARSLSAEGTAAIFEGSTEADPGASREHRLRRADGSSFAGEVALARFIDGDGATRHSIAIRDVSERQRLDAERLAIAEQLQHSRKMEAIGQLAGGIAHDFNNILTTVLGYSAMLERALAAGSKTHEWAARISASGARATELVKQILTFARRGGVEKGAHDLVPISTDAISLLKGSLPSTTELEAHLPLEPLICNVNPAQISQVLVNLCVNARDALNDQPGRIAVDVRRVAQSAEILALSGAERPGGTDRIVFGQLEDAPWYARIEVRDTGAGMAPDVLRHIFTPFYTTKQRGRGTGLGLAVVHGIVNDSGGACCVVSRPSEGTTVTIYLPILDGAAMPRTLPASAGSIEGSERVLVVDDEPFIGDLLATRLTTLGYAVTALTDPLEALARVEGDPYAFDVVITDQVMPKLTGLKLLERIKAIRPSLPVILCTGFSNDATEELVILAGASGFFQKPVAADQLARRIRDLFASPAALARSADRRPAARLGT